MAAVDVEAGDPRRRSLGEGTGLKRSPSDLKFEQGLKIMFKVRGQALEQRGPPR